MFNNDTSLLTINKQIYIRVCPRFARKRDKEMHSYFYSTVNIFPSSHLPTHLVSPSPYHNNSNISGAAQRPTGENHSRRCCSFYRYAVKESLELQQPRHRKSWVFFFLNIMATRYDYASGFDIHSRQVTITIICYCYCPIS